MPVERTHDMSCERKQQRGAALILLPMPAEEDDLYHRGIQLGAIGPLLLDGDILLAVGISRLFRSLSPSDQLGPVPGPGPGLGQWELGPRPEPRPSLLGP